MEQILLEDLEKLSKSELPFDKYRNSVFLVTGATGLIGSLIIKSLLYFNQKYQLDLKVLAAVRNTNKADKIFEEFSGDAALKLIKIDLESERFVLEGKVDFIIHAAAITTSKIMVANPVSTIKTAVWGTQAVLELAVEKRSKAVIYISSMEIYGQSDKQDKLNEKDLGYIELENIRSCYPEGKRMCECMCNAYASQFGVNVISARLAQTFGPGTLEGENRVFAQFARSAIKGENIVLHTKGDSEGNYVYTRDAIKGILLLLTKGKRGEAYNISNEECHTTIYEMAQMVANEIGKGQIKVVLDIPEDVSSLGYAPKVKMWLDSRKMNQLGWKAEVGLKESYERLIVWLKETER